MRYKSYLFICLFLIFALVSFGAIKETTKVTKPETKSKNAVVQKRELMEKFTEAAKQHKKMREAAQAAAKLKGITAPLNTPTLIVGTNGYYIPDYFSTPNWANSPPLTKFVDPLPSLYIKGGTVPAGAYIPVADPDKTTYPGSDYYEISLVQYQQKMHSDMNPTTLRGYVQTNTDDPNISQPHYLGPVIIAQKGVPVRIKFTNTLGTGAAGDLFIPVDPTIMGSGEYDVDFDPATKEIVPEFTGTYSQNRATLHLHGGLTPWISDGTPHQWTVPASESNPYSKGAATAYVPDMWFDATNNYAHLTACAGQTKCNVSGATNNPGPGSLTFFYTNDQSARLMFYHDHAYGITRLNVYVGEAAGYLITDSAEQNLVNSGTVPADQIPLVIQDKTFVDANSILSTDPTWAWGSNPGKPVTATPVTGDLWWPHVYMPAENPYAPDGMNAFGRWMYGPWFFPPTPVCDDQNPPPLCITHGTVTNEYYDPNCIPSDTNMCQPPQRPGTDNPSWGAEAFMDTPIVNGMAYPKLDLPEAKQYRFRILNASHDRFLNLQLYKASSIISGISIVDGGSGYNAEEPPEVTITGDGVGATASATVDPVTGAVTQIILDTVGSRYTTAGVSIAQPVSGNPATATADVYTSLTEVGMVPAVNHYPGVNFPPAWIPALDSREGGVPDPANRGPAFIQIGTEGGFIPTPTVLKNQPVAWNLDPTTFNFGNVLNQQSGGGTLFLGPAERADVIVDFTNFAGQTLILYNDAPTAFPALDPHYNYYTLNPDRTDMGSSLPTVPGMGPNIRTIMQIVVPGTPTISPPNDYNPATLTALQTAFTGPTGIFGSSQDPIAVGQTPYNANYEQTFPTGCSANGCWGIVGVTDLSDTINFKQTDGTDILGHPVHRVAIHDEMGASFDEYGRMSAKLGLEIHQANAATQNFVLQSFIDPISEVVHPGEIQIWRFTHNGVDTHPIHFHLFDVQVLNRQAWDGMDLRLPDVNELGWKDTVRISPLEDTIVALRAKQPPVPWPLPGSYHPFNVNTKMNDMMGFTQIDQTDGGPLTPPIVNQMVNFGWEYVWHCHILSHEENDMMRGIILQVPPEIPATLTSVEGEGGVNVQWTDKSASETGFTLQRADDFDFTMNMVSVDIPASDPITAFDNPITYLDTTTIAGQNYYYRVRSANNATFDHYDAALGIVTANLFSEWSNTSATIAAPIATVLPTALSFGDQPVNTSSPSQTVTLSNAGGLVLTINGITAGGDFSIVNNCGTTLDTGLNCTIDVVFTPTAPLGAKSGNLVITSDDPANPTLTVPLSGNATGPVISVAPTALVFPNQVMNTTSAAQMLTVTNTGSAPLTVSGVAIVGSDFAWSYGVPCAIVAPNASCTINVTFTPTALGARVAQLVISSDDVANPTFNVSLSGTCSQPIAGINPGSLTYPNQLLGTTSAPQTVTLSNTGNAALNITSISAIGNFAQTNDCGTSLAANLTCTISVTFTPTVLGPNSSSLVATTDDPVNPTLSVALSGVCNQAIAVVTPASLPFADQLVNQTSAPLAVTLANNGNIPLTVVSTVIGSPNFAILNSTCGATVPAGTNCVINVVFTPTARTTYASSLTVTTDDLVNPVASVALSGKGIAPVAGVSPTSLAFGTQLVGTTSQPQIVTVSNNGDAPLTVSSVSMSGTNPGDFSQTNNCSVVLIGSSCAVEVSFRPSAAGNSTANLVISETDPITPSLTVPLTGTGSALSIIPSAIVFDPQAVGTRSGFKSSVMTNVGTSAITFTSIAITGVNATDFTPISGNCPVVGGTLTSGASCTMNVRFRPSDVGLRIAAITIVDSDPSSPQSVSLTGTGTVSGASVDPTSLGFGSVPVNTTSSPQTVTLTSTGSGPLLISSIRINGNSSKDFAIQSNNCPPSLAVGASCQVVVTFTPTKRGTRTSSLAFTDDAPDSPQVVALSGTGQ